MIFSFPSLCVRGRERERERERKRERERPFIIDPLQDSFWGCELWAPAGSALDNSSRHCKFYSILLTSDV